MVYRFGGCSKPFQVHAASRFVCVVIALRRLAWSTYTSTRVVSRGEYELPQRPQRNSNTEQYGILVPVADVAALANAILAQLDTQHDRFLLEQRGRSLSEEEAVKNYRNVLLST